PRERVRARSGWPLLSCPPVSRTPLWHGLETMPQQNRGESPMSTATPQPQPTPTPQAPPSDDVREVIIYSHSSLYYWWPVWVVGFIMAFITAFNGVKVAIPPGGPDE